MRRGAAVAAGVLVALLVAGGVVAAAATGPAAVAGAPLRVAPAVPAQGAGDGTVLLSADALAHPAADAVRRQLQVYFDAINRRDYAAWAATVVAERSAALSQERWLEDYASTRDGTIRIDRIDDIEGGRVLVRVRFVSTQDLADAPTDTPSTRVCWRVSLPMGGEPPLIEQAADGSSVAQAC